jgi:hypothetical protein
LPALIAAIPSIVGLLGGLGAAAGGVTAIVNSVKTAKHQTAQKEEIKRHNLEMEKIAREKKTLNFAGSGLKTKTTGPKGFGPRAALSKTKTKPTWPKTKTTGSKIKKVKKKNH